jgi:hypothetical protein
MILRFPTVYIKELPNKFVNVLLKVFITLTFPTVSIKAVG